MKKYLKGCLLILVLITILFISSYKKENKEILAFQEKEEPKYVALTFDDGPNHKYTNMLLDGLKEKNVKATFFVLGNNAATNYETLKRIADEGHLIGNHTYSHKNLYRLKEKEILKEIDKTNQVIEAVTGDTVKYFRPSYGNYNSKIVKLSQMEVVLWNVDSLDWKIKNSKRITNRVLKKVNDGSIILMHDIYKSSVKAALMIIDKLKEEGYEFLRVDELLAAS